MNGIKLELTETEFVRLFEKVMDLKEPERSLALKFLVPYGEDILRRREELRARILGRAA